MKYILLLTFVVVVYALYKPSINLINDPDIILPPGGLLGFYVLGICHFIKTNYNIEKKKVIGFSAGSFNTIFLSLDKDNDHKFLTELFKLNLHATMQLPVLLHKTIKLMNELFDITDFNTANKYIAVTTDYNRLDGYNQFLNMSDMTECCISSSFIPFVTYNDLFYFYKGRCSVDGGLLYSRYKKKVKSCKPLLLNYKLFKRFNKYNIPGYGLLYKNCTIYDLYILGYHDAIKNKTILDDYLLV